MSTHYTNEGDFQTHGEAGDSLHTENTESRQITDSVMLSVSVAENGARTMRVREVRTGHRKELRSYETVESVRTYVTKPGSLFVTMRFSMSDPVTLVGRTDVGRHSFPALKRAHAAHTATE